MSNRTLLEINHDYAGMIDMNPQAFAYALTRYLASGSSRDVGDELRQFGVRVGPMRHHTDPFQAKDLEAFP
jgi:hypothetical protein